LPRCLRCRREPKIGLVGGEPPQAEFTTSLEQLVDGKVALENKLRLRPVEFLLDEAVALARTSLKLGRLARCSCLRRPCWDSCQTLRTTNSMSTPPFPRGCLTLPCVIFASVSTSSTFACWICGTALKSRFTFVLGPAQVMSQTTTEPPSHLRCNAFAVSACPFLSTPQYRRTDTAERSDSTADVHALHNPGCFALWTTRSYHRAGAYLTVGRPVKVDWFYRGERASRDRVIRAFETYRSKIADQWFETAMRYLPAPMGGFAL
jgi:hypothetical protein